MDEIIYVDHRSTSVVHETDRNSDDLLANAYQQITNAQPRRHPDSDGVQHRVSINVQPVQMQEAQS
ncbi:MAG TPA: hypothetical protein DDX19_04585 [Rhodopirellula baltica]|uniref:Uncharacterized protein n=2 Tax=Rhodopirellula baltica TaxID=265606 RepID=Q7URZ2_RHOBA|nr:hypothetical protein [Rhodopirellula baltica]EKK02774.1 hypothetical protein RBSH_01905 [Rhodopirellula baltica SH28]CAD74193.1 hypothetical protein RB5368 [Rhodopirellula baltica SH 1]HBE62043.1 hypothetical protein [Rhodopirellula baltica]